MIKVLFVCLGNICRSPMAEAVFMHKVRLANLADQITADSAGTGSWHVGEPPHHGTRKILKSKGIDYSNLARVFRRSDWDEFDIILTMDESNYEDVKRTQPMKHKAELHRLLEFAPKSGLSEVPDPWYTGNFEQTYDLADQAAEGLLSYLIEKYSFKTY